LLKNDVDKAVVRSPEKAGVGGSTPSLATIFSMSYIFFFSNFLRREGAISWVERNLGLLERSRHLKPRQLDSSRPVGAEHSFQALFALSGAFFCVKSRQMCELKANDH
jgi:hypothetical protein